MFFRAKWGRTGFFLLCNCFLHRCIHQTKNKIPRTSHKLRTPTGTEENIFFPSGTNGNFHLKEQVYSFKYARSVIGSSTQSTNTHNGVCGKKTCFLLWWQPNIRHLVVILRSRHKRRNDSWRNPLYNTTGRMVKKKQWWENMDDDVTRRKFSNRDCENIHTLPLGSFSHFVERFRHCTHAPLFF